MIITLVMHTEQLLSSVSDGLFAVMEETQPGSVTE